MQPFPWDRVVDQPNGCREWQGARTPQGYGHLTRDGRQVYAHRAAWEEANGPIPDGLLVCHHCDNPPCVNRDHLFLGTKSDNARDMVAKGRGSRALAGIPRVTHCRNGHLRTAENTRVVANRRRRDRVTRECLICLRATKARSYRRAQARTAA